MSLPLVAFLAECDLLAGRSLLPQVLAGIHVTAAAATELVATGAGSRHTARALSPELIPAGGDAPSRAVEDVHRTALLLLMRAPYRQVQPAAAAVIE